MVDAGAFVEVNAPSALSTVEINGWQVYTAKILSSAGVTNSYAFLHLDDAAHVNVDGFEESGNTITGPFMSFANGNQAAGATLNVKEAYPLTPAYTTTTFFTGGAPAIPVLRRYNSAMVLANSDTTNTLKIAPQANASASTSVGGAVNIDNTLSTGAGLVIYSNQASPSGRALVVNAAHTAFNQAAAHIIHNGTTVALTVASVSGGISVTNTGGGSGAHAITGVQSATSGSNASAGNFASSNPDASAFQLSGVESGRGTIKIAHVKPAVSDANAAGVSIDLQGSGTAAQGLFITSTDAGGTTGALIKCRNNNSANNLFVVNPDGSTFLGNTTAPRLGACGISEWEPVCHTEGRRY
jgi:hyaluronoglucosaminidase